MARRSEFYKGRRKKRNYAIIPGIAFLLLFSVGIVLFYSTQKYAVVSDDGVSVELPILSSGNVTYDESGHAVTSFEPVSVEVQFEEADYSGVAAVAGRGIRPIRAIFVPYDDVNEEKITGYANRLSSGNALLLDLKRADGYLAWYSDSAVAFSYNLNMVLPETKETLRSIVASLKADKVYVAAQISCCVDALLGARNAAFCLKDINGMNYYDGTNYWLDPYNPVIRDYTVQLVKELWDLGFDEVVLNNVMHPVAEPIQNDDGTSVQTIYYTREMSTTPTPLGAVSGFAVNVAEQLSDREEGKYLSIYINSTTALVRPDAANGQDAELFFKLYDRVYYNTDKYAYTFNVQDIEPLCTVGSIKNRFVPVVINYLPDNTSWILVDQEQS